MVHRAVKCFSVVFAVVTVCFVLSGCGGGGGGGAGAAPTPTGSIDGFVYVPTGGAARVASAPAGYQPLAGAVVTISGTSVVGSSDPDGYYSISGVPVGTRTITISKDGYLPIQRTITVVENQKTRVTEENTTQGAMNFVAISRPEAGASISDVDFRATDTFYIEIIHAVPLAAGTLSVTLKMDDGAAQSITAYFSEVNGTTLRTVGFSQFARSLFPLPTNDRNRTMTVTVSARTNSGVSGTVTCSFTVYPVAPPAQ